MSQYDRLIPIFSADGRLYQVEYAFKAISAAGATCVAIKGKNGAVVVTQKKIQDKLIDSASVSTVFRITSKIGCVGTGLIADVRLQVLKAIYEAEGFAYKNGFDMPCDLLAKRMADLNQTSTQNAGARLLGAALIFIAIDDENGPVLYKVDPAGYFVGYMATSAGPKSQEITNALEKSIKNAPVIESNEELLKLAISTLCNAVGSDLKASEIEVGAVTTDANGSFSRLTETQIEDYLNKIAEAD